MQTFISDINMEQNAKNLDNKRLGKQRIECIQILNCLLIKESRWKCHPAVKMWKGHEIFLTHNYLRPILNEWIFRGFKNIKCEEHFENISSVLNYNKSKNMPKWLTEEFIESHRSNLIRKNYDFYKPKFPNTKLGLEYIWPVK